MKKLISTTAVVLLSLSARATVFNYTVFLSGPQESPANASPGTGVSSIAYDDVLHTLSINTTFSGLLGNTTASHIHATTATPFSGTAGVATTTPSFVGFPLGVTAGSHVSVYDLTLASSFNSAFITANGGITANAEAALASAMANGRAYLNIHTSQFAGGEIRGFTQVPEAGTTAAMGAAALAILAEGRRQMRRRSVSRA